MKMSDSKQHEGAKNEPTKDPIGASMTSDTEAIVRLLTEEIRDRHEKGKLEGWTPWVLAASLVSIASILLQDLWGTTAHWESIKASFLITSLALFAVLDFRSTLNIITGRKNNKTNFSFLHANGSPMQAIVTICWFSGIGFMARELNSGLNSPFVGALGWMFIAIAFSGSLSVVVVISRLPLPFTSPRPLASSIMTFIMSTMCITTIVKLWSSSLLVGSKMEEARAGSLVALGAYALCILARGHSSQSSKKDELIELRQEIVLENLSYGEALHRTRIALRGMFLSDLVAQDMAFLMKGISDVRMLYTQSFSMIAVLKNSAEFNTLNKEAPAGLSKLALANTLDVLKTYKENTKEISKVYFKRLKSVELRLSLAVRLAKSATADKHKLLSEIKHAQALADADLEKFVSEYEVLQNAWNAWYPSETRNYVP